MLTILAISTAALAAAGAPPFQPQLPSWKPRITDICASSGLRLVTIEDPRAPGGIGAIQARADALAHLDAAAIRAVMTPCTARTEVAAGRPAG